jgi:D-alanyl-D-alanine dipeptidase
MAAAGKQRRRRIVAPEDLFAPIAGHPVETIANLDAIPITDNGEPLVDLRAACPGIRVEPRVDVWGWRNLTLWARQGVAERLNAAQRYLDAHHPGQTLIIVDAHRSAGQQARMHRICRLLFRLTHPTWPSALVREAANRLVATPDAVHPPPHTTGGAVDVYLRGPDGRPVFVGGAGFRPSTALTAYPHLDDETRQYRAVLCEAMNAAGFSNYEEEWWHWSWGDSGWALRTNQPAAFYGRRERI